MIETGSKVRAFREGDRYFRPTVTYAGSRHDGYTPITGGFAEYGVITDVRAMQEDGLEPPGYAKFQMNVPADAGLDPGDATMLITLKEVAGFVANLNVTLNQQVVVLGAGSVAMAMVFFAKLRGACPLIAVGRRDPPLAALRRFGVNAAVNTAREAWAARVLDLTAGRGADLVIDTAGDDHLVIDEVSARMYKYGNVPVGGTAADRSLDLLYQAMAFDRIEVYRQPDQSGVDTRRVSAVDIVLTYDDPAGWNDI